MHVTKQRNKKIFKKEKKKTKKTQQTKHSHVTCKVMHLHRR